MFIYSQGLIADLREAKFRNLFLFHSKMTTIFSILQRGIKFIWSKDFVIFVCTATYIAPDVAVGFHIVVAADTITFNHITFIVTLCVIHTMSNEGKHLLGVTLVVSELRIKGAGTLVTRSMVR